MSILTEAEKLQLCLERDRLLCSSEFTRSPTMSKLLRFLVDYKLAENNKPLTAYAVAVDGLGRDDSFDTQIDSYPRVQIGRLRRMLDHFYLREKSDNRLSIPYQHYEIILGSNEAASDPGIFAADPDTAARTSAQPQADVSPPPIPAGRLQLTRGHVIAMLALFLMSAVGIVYFLQKSEADATTTIRYPAVVVKAANGIPPSSNAQVDMTHSYLVGALEKFDQLRIFDEQPSGTFPSQYFLESSNLDAAADQMQLRLVTSDSREVIWSSRVDLSTMQELHAELDQAVIEIAGPYGKIAQHELSKYRGDYSPGYPCLLQFHQYMRFRDPANLEPVLRCMNKSARSFPDDSYLMSMLAVAKNIAELFDVGDAIEGSGKDFALRAAKIDNSSASATFAVAQTAFFEGDCLRGRSWGERAVGLNPLNSRIMGYLGMYMLTCDMPEGEAYATKALEMDANSDLAIAATVAMEKLRRGEARAAQQLSSKYLDSVPGSAIGLEISYILSSAALGEKREARKAWRELAHRSGFPETAEPRDVLAKWIANPDLLRKLDRDFEKVQLY